VRDRKVVAFIPGDKFPAVTITGYSCSLMCDFCRGKYLKGMTPVRKPRELYDLANRVWERGGRGLLVSGGFDKYGKLPIRPYLSVIRDIKKDFDLIISIHPGFLEREVIVKLKECKVDIIDYSFAFNPLLLKYMRLNLKPEDVVKHFREWLRVGFEHVVPHILLGLRGYISRWDYEALRALLQFNPHLIVLLVFIPTKGTPLESLRPPLVKDILDYVNYANKTLQCSEISLGCMRPVEYKDSLDELLISSKLVNRVANPHKRLIEKYGLLKVETCCSVPYSCINCS